MKSNKEKFDLSKYIGTYTIDELKEVVKELKAMIKKAKKDGK